MTVLGSLSPLSSAPLIAASPLSILPVVNPVAGNGDAYEVSANVRNICQADARLQDQYHMLPSLLTEENQVATIRGIANEIAAFRKSQPEAGLRLLSLGGDGTFRHVIQGALLYVFPQLRDMISLPAEVVQERMLASGIEIATLSLGSVSDMGIMTGAPKLDESAIIDYLRDGIRVPINLGYMTFPDSPFPVIFSHNASAGTTIADMFKETADGHGKKVHRKRTWVGFKKITWPNPFNVEWRTSAGIVKSLRTREVMVHGTPLANATNGFPGTPLAGLGFLGFPDVSFFQLLRLFLECRSRGKKALQGEAQLLASDQSLARLDQIDPDLQPQLQLGQSVQFHFHDEAGQSIDIPVQADGDYIRDVSGLTVHALPPWPAVMMKRDSLLHRVYLRNREILDSPE